MSLHERSSSMTKPVRKWCEGLRIIPRDASHNLVRREAAWPREGLSCGLVQALASPTRRLRLLSRRWPWSPCLRLSCLGAGRCSLPAATFLPGAAFATA